MKPFRITTILTTAALATALTGCAEDEPTVESSPPAEQAERTEDSAADTGTEEDDAGGATDDSAASADQATAPPTDGEDDGDNADDEAGEGNGGGGDQGEGDLPTEPTAYGDRYIQAWVDREQDLIDRMAGGDVIQHMEMWSGQGWERTDAVEEEHGAYILSYVDDEEQELEIWVHEPTIMGGGDHGVTSATILNADVDLPDTLEGYATDFLEAAASGNQDLAEAMGTEEALAHTDKWASGDWGALEISNGSDEDTALATFGGDGGVALVFVLDREQVAFADTHGVVNVLVEGAILEEGPEEYADAFVRAFGEGQTDLMGVYATPEVVDQLADAGGPGWARTGVEDGGDGTTLASYEDSDSGRELTLTLDNDIVDTQQYAGIIGAEITGP